ncbi:MAG: putative metal-binding motif-containing protein [Deltaproteobacteria bacterium]|nr:putative metal-binding motif-containing protein [Deltaproteobacteria bacterium]
MININKTDSFKAAYLLGISFILVFSIWGCSDTGSGINFNDNNSNDSDSSNTLDSSLSSDGNDGSDGSSDNNGSDDGSDSDSSNNGSGDDTPPDCIDNDKDGWCVPHDCDDNNASVYPTAVETKGTPYDDNCNGLTDDIYVPPAPNTELSYIWIANSYDGTVSKVNTKTLVEEARYKTCPYSSCDPSRTSVNRYGDMVVTNRFYSIPGGVSSVTKIAGFLKDCVDVNGDNKITTSTGPTDIKPWGADECVLWNTELPFITDLSPRARATAWDGTEDPDTGEGGYVLIGSCIGGELNDYNEWEINTINRVYFLNGNTGAVETSMTKDIPSSACLYGGAMDRLHNFWIMDGFGFPSNGEGGGLVKVDIGANTVTRFQAQCGYGISVDQLGNVWLGGKKYNSPGVPDHVSCVQKFNSTTGKSTVTTDQTGVFLRGIAVGAGVSDGFTWAAESLGHLYRIDADTMDVKIYETPVTKNTGLKCDSLKNTCDNGLVGVAVDFDGYVWMVSTTEDSAYKFDPVNETFETVEIGHLPYTYSDMTGMQLRNVFIVH